MTTASGVLLVVLVVAAVASIWDIERDAERTLVIYTTPALRDLLEKELIPRFGAATGHAVSPVYIAAGQQYNRLRMSGDDAEADLFLHASPLYLEKGLDSGHIEPFRLAEDALIEASYKARETSGGRAWYAFAWSPLVQVHPAGAAAAPDLATTDVAFGFPHPLLSNNGVYAVLFLEHIDEDIGKRLLSLTRVQPQNARANIGGVADGSFGLTLGYEAVVKFYQAQGAAVAYEAPLVHGRHVTTPVVFSAALVAGERHSATEDFLAYLFTPEAQDLMSEHHFRPVLPGAREPEGTLDLAGVESFDQDWSRWHELEGVLPNYEVKS